MKCCEINFGNGRRFHSSLRIQVSLFGLIIIGGVLTAAPVGWQSGSDCVFRTAFDSHQPPHIWIWHFVTNHAVIVGIAIPLFRIAIGLYRFYNCTMVASGSKYYDAKAMLSTLHFATTFVATVLLLTEYYDFCIELDGAVAYKCQETQQLELMTTCLADHQYFYHSLMVALVATLMSTSGWFMVAVYDCVQAAGHCTA